MKHKDKPTQTWTVSPADGSAQSQIEACCKDCAADAHAKAQFGPSSYALQIFPVGLTNPKLSDFIAAMSKPFGGSYEALRPVGARGTFRFTKYRYTVEINN